MPPATLSRRRGIPPNPWPAPDHYDDNFLVAPQLSTTPDLTPISLVYSQYGNQQQFANWRPVADKVLHKIEAIYQKHNLKRCRHYGLYIAGSENDIKDENRDRMMILVIELMHLEINRWQDIDHDMQSILEEFELGAEQGHGVCVRYYKQSDRGTRVTIGRRNGRNDSAAESSAAQLRPVATQSTATSIPTQLRQDRENSQRFLASVQNTNSVAEQRYVRYDPIYQGRHYPPIDNYFHTPEAQNQTRGASTMFQELDPDYQRRVASLWDIPRSRDEVSPTRRPPPREPYRPVSPNLRVYGGIDPAELISSSGFDTPAGAFADYPNPFSTPREPPVAAWDPR